MRVKCIRVPNPPPDEMDRKTGKVTKAYYHATDVTLGKVYEVLSTRPLFNEKLYYGIIDDLGDDTFYPADHFEVVES